MTHITFYITVFTSVIIDLIIIITVVVVVVVVVVDTGSSGDSDNGSGGAEADKKLSNCPKKVPTVMICRTVTQLWQHM